MKEILFNLTGILSVFLISINTIICVSILFFVVLLKSIIPIKKWRMFCTRILNAIATFWISVNNLNIILTKSISWDVEGLDGLKKDKNYLVISNHQSWLDIVVLQKVLNTRIPMLKFFLKDVLVWVPFLGIAWWALDFPFMKRYSAAETKKNPGKAGTDIESTIKACEKFRYIPVSVMNFVEGHRFSAERKAEQNSPFSHLLKPKAGGIALVLSAMSEVLNSILNVTIVYPEGNFSFWDFLCGKIRRVIVRIQELPLTSGFTGDYSSDPVFRERFQKMLNDLWAKKDAEMKMMLGEKQ